MVAGDAEVVAEFGDGVKFAGAVELVNESEDSAAKNS